MAYMQRLGTKSQPGGYQERFSSMTYPGEEQHPTEATSPRLAQEQRPLQETLDLTLCTDKEKGTVIYRPMPTGEINRSGLEVPWSTILAT